jgi:MFS family permease
MRERRTFLAVNGSVFLFMLGVGMVVPILPGIVAGLAGTPSAAGYLASAFAVSYVALQVPVGRLADRWGFRPFIALGYGLCGVSGILYFFGGSLPAILFGRLLQGAGEAPVWALAPALLALRNPASKGKIIGTFNASLHLGLTLGPLLGLLMWSFGWRQSAFLFFSGVSAASALLVALFAEDRDPVPTEKTATEKTDFRKAAAFAAGGPVSAVLAGVVLYGAGYGLFVTTVPAFLIDVKGLSQGTIFFFFALYYVAIGVTQSVAGALSDRWGRKRFLAAGMAAAASGLAFFPGFDRAAVMAPLLVAGLGFGTFHVTSMAWMNERAAPSLKGTISGLYYLAWGIGYFSGPPLIGKLGDVFGYGTAFAVFAALLLLEGAVLSRMRHPRGEEASEGRPAPLSS